MDYLISNTTSISKDNEAARRRLRRRITNTLRKPTTLSTKLAEDRKRVPTRERIVNRVFTLPVITTCKVVITSEVV
jgi:hypothetical protein